MIVLLSVIVALLVLTNIQLYSLIKRKDRLMSVYDDLTSAVNSLASSIDAYVTFTDNLFAALQAALANQVPADALAAVQAAVNTATAEKTKIDADIAKDTPPASGQG